MLTVAHFWDWLVATGLAVGWFVGAAGFGLLRARRWQRSRSLEEGEAEARIETREPRLAFPLLAATIGLPVAVLLASPRHGGSAWIMPGLWLGAVFVASSGYNAATSVVVAGFENTSGVVVVRRRVGWRRERRLMAGALLDPPRFSTRLVAAPVLALGLIAVAATAMVLSNRPSVPSVFRQPDAQTEIVPALGRVATALDGTPIDVRCYSTREWSLIEQQRGRSLSGLAGSEIELSPGVCDELLAFMAGGLHPSGRYRGSRRELAFAVQVLAHETVHMTGIGDEAITECYGMQHLAATASIMGADPAYARELAGVYWNDLYPYESAPYRSSQCHRGGALDLRISSDWP